MDPDDLRDHLSKLHEELHKVSPADPQTDQVRGEMLEDVKRLLEAPREVDDSLADRLERAAVQFEANHPTLAASSRRLIDLLGKAGM
ncbi:MAG TPA: DUF4404 family protein [Steroidobacteraceae bacterium]|nr:DUF4404 family protein [Steroidobacteraceae bacterium]HUO19933.1 DUF4404 family protein [Steroidobacteraceae bacterium]